jgi:polysaccharide biosynthesis/export protein
MKLRKAIGLLSCMLLCLTPYVRAQRESLLIGSGDMVHIVIFDAPELEQHARVTDSGEVPLLMGGNVKIASLSPEQAGAAIGKALVDGHLLVNPRVSVTVDQYATQNVSVIGEVRAPGAYPITTGRTVGEVLALAGGLMPDADRKILIQRRGSGDYFTYFFSNSPLVTPDSVAAGANPAKSVTLVTRDTLVYPGDTVRVSKAELVFALGDLGRPGGFPVVNNDSNLTVLQLVALAGGTAHTAVPSHARLIRKTPDGGFQEIPLPLSDMQKGKKPDQLLQANDILYVPFSYMRNAALGLTALAAAATTAAIYAY